MTSRGWLEASARPLRMPPRIKVLEALSAVAGGRVERLGGGWYRVRSSDGTRVYRVYVDPSRGLVYSDDNGTRLRGYIGYPIIAVLMLEGLLPYDREAGEALRDIPWRELNERYRRYAPVMEYAFRVAGERGVPRERLEKLIADVLAGLRRMRLRGLPEPPGGRGEDQE